MAWRGGARLGGGGGGELYLRMHKFGAKGIVNVLEGVIFQIFANWGGGGGMRVALRKVHTHHNSDQSMQTPLLMIDHRSPTS